MKYRCPHCRKEFESLEGSRCPGCGKTLRRPDRWMGLKKTDPGRRAALQQRLAAKGDYRKPLWFVFANRPRFFMWVLGACILVGGFAMTIKLPTAIPYRGGTTEMRTRKELVVIRTALEWFRAHCKRYPTTEESLKALVRDPGVPGWNGFYLSALLPDLWNHPFQYSCTNDTIRLYSMGPDGKAGTADDINSPPPDYKALAKRLAMDKPKPQGRQKIQPQNVE